MQIGSPAERAALAEHAVRIRSIRRLWAIPGTRLGVVSHPARPPHRLLLGWQYWWQAHLFDCRDAGGAVGGAGVERSD